MMGRRKAAIGVDIGGTKISAGIVGGEGLVYASPCTIATNPKEPGEVIISNLFSLLKNILADAADYDIQGIGIGCTGPLDIDKGILLDVENLPTLNYFPLKDTVEQVFPLRVILDNDANALIYAEALWGAGRNAGSVLGFTLGTGIGCAWINGGKVWRGHSGCAGEVWTSPYKKGILEDYVSGNAVTRLYYGIFWAGSEPGQKSASDGGDSHMPHPHESPLAMTLPLMLLAVVTIVAGFIPFGHFISSNGEAYNIHLDWSVAGTSIAVAVVSIAIATYIYAGSRQPVADTLAHRFKGLWTAAYHRFYLDEVYQFITHRIIFGCICRPIAWWDRHVVDGFFNFLAWSAEATSDEIRGLQSGRIQQYTFVFLLGTLALILLLLL